MLNNIPIYGLIQYCDANMLFCGFNVLYNLMCNTELKFSVEYSIVIFGVIQYYNVRCNTIL